MYKIFLDEPEIFVYTKSLAVKNFIEGFPELKPFPLGVAKSIIPNSPVYSSFKDFLTDFRIDESEMKNDLISVFNPIIELNLVFQFATEDLGGMEAESMDPESEFTWEKKNVFTSITLVNGELKDEVRADIEKKFLSEFKKCDHCNGLINSIEL